MNVLKLEKPVAFAATVSEEGRGLGGGKRKNEGKNALLPVCHANSVQIVLARLWRFNIFPLPLPQNVYHSYQFLKCKGRLGTNWSLWVSLPFTLSLSPSFTLSLYCSFSFRSAN